MRTLKFYKIYLFIILIVDISLLVLGIKYVGIGWDAQIDSIAATEFENVRQYSDLQTAYSNIFYTSEFYGNFLQYSANKLKSFFNSAETVIDPYAINTYKWQTFVNVLIFIFLGIVLSSTTKLIFNSFKIELYTLTVYLTFPVLFGMSLVNFKDIPVMAGVSLVSCGFIQILATGKHRYLNFFALITIGLIISFGTRVGIFYILIFIILCNYLFILMLKSFKKINLNILYLTVSLLLSLFCAFFILRMINPLIKIDIIQLIIDSYNMTSNNPLSIDNKIANQTLNSTNLPWWYIPVWLIVKIPLLQLLIFIISLVLLFKTYISHFYSNKLYFVFPFIVQSVIVPILLIVYRPVMYDEIRHILFIYTGLILFNSVFFYGVMTYKPKKSFLIRNLVILLFMLLPFLNLVYVYKWFPYSYAYINEIGKYSGQEKSWDVDYWGVSSQEGVMKLQKYSLNAIVVSPSISTSFYLGTKKPEDLDMFEKSNYGFYKFYRFDNFNFDDNCEKIFEISRDGFKLGAGAICSE